MGCTNYCWDSNSPLTNGWDVQIQRPNKYPTPCCCLSNNVVYPTCWLVIPIAIPDWVLGRHFSCLACLYTYVTIVRIHDSQVQQSPMLGCRHHTNCCCGVGQATPQQPKCRVILLDVRASIFTRKRSLAVCTSRVMFGFVKLPLQISSGVLCLLCCLCLLYATSGWSVGSLSGAFHTFLLPMMENTGQCPF